MTYTVVKVSYGTWTVARTDGGHYYNQRAFATLRSAQRYCEEINAIDSRVKYIENTTFGAHTLKVGAL